MRFRLPHRAPGGCRLTSRNVRRHYPIQQGDVLRPRLVPGGEVLRPRLVQQGDVLRRRVQQGDVLHRHVRRDRLRERSAIAFVNPRQWGPPAPTFDWDGDLSRKPENWTPQNWPPTPIA